jgi:saccharopine dehydrogenase-like NADP-dependent oxidoreductase
MRQVVILGVGKIGSLIATLLVECGVFLGDMDPEVVARLQKDIGHEQFQVSSVDVQDSKALGRFIESVRPEGIISSLPYSCNPLVSELPLEIGAYYFDLTGDDAEVTGKIRAVSQGSILTFEPQCAMRD